MKPAEVQFSHQQFVQELASLKGDALLDKKAAFDALPEAEEGARDLRLLQSMSLEAALIGEFGLGKWQAALEERRNAQSNA